MGIIAFFIPDKKILYRIFIFFIPFNATAIINFGAPPEMNSLQPSIFIGVLILLERVLISIKLKTINKRFLIFFWPIVLLFFINLMNVLFFKNKIYYKEGVLQTIKFDISIITQFLYFFFWLAITIIISNLKKSLILKTVYQSAVFTSIWGWVQLFLSFWDIKYPFMVFNNSQNTAAMGWVQKIGDTNISRISSVSMEPSYFAIFLLVVISILIGDILSCQKHKMPITNKLILLVFFFFTAIATTSSNAYIGIIFIFIIIFYHFVKKRRINRITFFSSVFFVVFIPIILLLIPITRELLFYYLINKTSTFSFYQRFFSIIESFNTFLEYPILGVGFGQTKSHSLITWILSSTGIMGLILFVIFFYNFIKRYNLKYIDDVSVLLSIYFIFFASIISGAFFYFGFFWLPFILSLNGEGEKYCISKRL